MSQFERAEVMPKAVSAKELANTVTERVASQADYAAFTSVDTGVEHYPADITLAGLDRALGTRITRLLLQADAEQTLHVSAQVLADHAKSRTRKDLQANLLVNVVKEVAQTQAEEPQETSRHCEDILRRCALEPEFKQKLKQTLFNDGALQSSKLTHILMD